MCIAIPVKIVAIGDTENSTVLVEDGDGREEVSAALVADTPQDLARLLGRWALVHTGFVLSLIDDADAASRRAVFAAMSGQAVDSADLRPTTAEQPPSPPPSSEV